MGLLTLSELIGEVQSGLLGRTDLTQSRCVTALNFAQAMISRKHDFKEMKGFWSGSTQFTSSATADKTVALTVDVKHIHTIVLRDDTNSRKLVQKPWREFDKLFPMPEAFARGIPGIYSQWGQNIILYPVPDGVYTLWSRVTMFPQKFQIGNLNVTSKYVWKDELLIKLACGYLWNSFGRPDKAQELYGEVGILGDKPTGLLASAIKQDTDEPDMEIDEDFSNVNVDGNYWIDPFMRGTPR